jgi:CheY-like chemotaxis protein
MLNNQQGSEQAPQEESEQASRKTKLILLVEDDEAIGEVILQAIQLETPYYVKYVSNGAQALQFLQEITPHLLILDYFLPDMNGLQVYDHFQAGEEDKRIPTLFISANAPTGELRKRPVSYLKKPFELDELLQTVERLLA